MSTIRKTITFTKQQDEWIKAQIEEGNFTNDSEYVRNLVRQDQLHSAKYQSLKNKLVAGLDSGISNKSLPDIMKEVETAMRTNGQL